MVKGSKNLQTETATRETMRMVSPQDKANTIGLMEASLRDSSKTDSGMGKEFGKSQQDIVTSMKENMLMIKNKARVSSPGKMATCIRVVTRMT